METAKLLATAFVMCGARRVVGMALESMGDGPGSVFLLGVSWYMVWCD